MKPSKFLARILLFILAFAGTGCAYSDTSNAEKTVRTELDLLKNLDRSTVQKYAAYTDLIPSEDEDPEITAEIEDILTLFFKNFDYQIMDVSLDIKSGKGIVKVQLQTIDARSLARDYVREKLQAEILSHARQTEEAASSSGLSAKDRILLFSRQLREHQYETIKKTCTIKLEKAGRKWSIIRSSSLENDLVGGLISCLSDSNLLTPEETLTVFFHALKEMNTEEISVYLGVEELLTDENPEESGLAAALAGQVLACFDFTVTECEVNGYQALVQVEITSFDSHAILEKYQKEVQEYLARPEAVVDGQEARYDHCLEILLSCIKNNKETVKTASDFHMVNNGAGWNLEDESTELGQALFGNFGQDESEIISEAVLAETSEYAS